MTNVRGVLAGLTMSLIAVGCGGGSSGTAGGGGNGGSSAAGSTGSSGSTGIAGTGSSAGAGGSAPDGGIDATVDTGAPETGGSDAQATGGLTGKFAVSAFDTFTSSGANYLQCGPDGTCYGNRGRINKLPPGSSAWVSIGDSTNGLITASPSSMLRDKAGNLYTNACAGAPGVYKLPAGGTTWATIGTGLGSNNPTSCNWNTAAIDAAGTLYIGFAIDKALFKLPAGQTTWVDTGADLNNSVRSVAFRGGDVYVGHQSGVSVLKAGAAAWAEVGDIDSPSNANRITFDGAGNLYSLNNSTVHKLVAGTDKWLATTGVVMQDPSDIVFDADNNGYIVAPASGSMYSLLKLPAGTLAWTKVFDLGFSVNEVCAAMADDNIGHLVVQCQTKLLRSK